MKRHKYTYQVKITKVCSLIYVGVEGSEGISSLTVSPSKKFVAICEKAERGLCVIWDISGIAANPVV